MLLQNDELLVAFEAVKIASELCRNIQHRIIVDQLTKNDRSPVTVADYCSQAIICKAIRMAFPNDPIIAEEGSKGLREEKGGILSKKIIKELHTFFPDVDNESIYRWIDYGNSTSYSDRFWTLDPIDGTKGFLRKDQYAISLALIENGEIKLGVLSCPNLAKHDPKVDKSGLMFIAQKGYGSFALSISGSLGDAENIRTNTSANISECAICESWESGHSNHSKSTVISKSLGISKPSVRIDSQAKYALVAMGKADIYLRLPTQKGYHEKIWDHAAGVLLVEEAGGKVADIFGNKLDFTKGTKLTENRGVVVSNSADIQNQLLDSIATI